MAHEFSLTANTLPANTCWTTPQDLLNLLPDYLTVNFAEPLSFFNFGETTPDPDFQDRPWIKLDSNGFVDGLYVFANGGWYKKHPLAPGMMMMFNGATNDVPLIDGGSSDNPFWASCDGNTYTGQGNVSGNAWSFTAPDLRSRFLVGTGQGAGVDGNGIALDNYTLGQTGGGKGGFLTRDQLPYDYWYFTPASNPGAPAVPFKVVQNSLPSGYGSSPGAATREVPTLPPYQAVNFVIRTPRVF